MNFEFRFTALLRGLLLLSAMYGLAGCMGRFERPRIPSVVNDRTASYTLDEYKADLGNYKNANDTDAFNLRNKMVYGLLAEIDYVFYDYETKLFLNQGTFKVGSDALQLGLAAGGTITNGERAKTILAALLSGVSGVSLSVDKNFFRQQSVQAISAAMEANRDQIKAVILQQLKQPNAIYSFPAARADLVRYFFAGTLPAGLQHLTQQAATNAQTQRTNLNLIQVKNITVDDVKQATELNAAVAQAFQSNNLAPVVAFLQAMGQPVDNSTPRDKLEQSLKELGAKITTDEALRAKYFTEAKKAGLIK